uniref:NADH-ubiquinone oxidoreductase chain 4 n=1 Tax=Trichogramma japonicum TaxID=311206 RepID=A0A384T0T4_9HYME|nr:NADH dehydrogenase subunit 4 [Trichogramma japonicum]AOM68232.1 NADH dehydrogenase subunit 4 [Trichogramma japonicum]
MMNYIFFIIMLIFHIIFNHNILKMYMIYLNLIIIVLLFMSSINFNYSWMMLYKWFGLDMISFSLILLSILIISLMYMVSLNVKNKDFFSLNLLFLLLFLILSFYSMNYFIFYIFFEMSLIPTFILIMGWGYQPERLNASMFMMLYTLFSSLPLMILIFYLFYEFNSMNYLILMNLSLKFDMFNSFLLYFFMFFSFFVKLPIFMFHMWLPKAHVEAPVSGSMILAGIMLKLGGYGLIRFMFLIMNYCLKFNFLFLLLSLLGMFILSILCLRQFDLKVLVAYSSVVHMGMMLMGLMSLSLFGLMGSLLMMIGHGLCSSALFFMVNLMYERTHSRNLLINKGMISLLPSLMMFWFMFCVCNMSSPPSLNLLSELLISNVLLNWSLNILLFLIVSMFLSCIYSLYLFSYCSHGLINNLLNKIYEVKMLDYLILLVHYIPLNLLFLKMDLFM